MPRWLDDLRALRRAPLLERLRHVDGLAPDASLTPAAVRDAVNDEDEDLEWLCDGLTRLLPADHRLDTLAELGEDRFFVAQALRAALGARLVDSSLAVLERASGAPTRALAELVGCWHESVTDLAAVAAHAPHFAALAGAADPRTASLAAVLATRTRAFAPPVLATLERMLEESSAPAPDGYDQQVDLEELIADIAEGGVALQPLAPALVPYLRCDAMAWRAAATLAAVGTGAAALVPEIESAYRRIPASEDLAQPAMPACRARASTRELSSRMPAARRPSGRARARSPTRTRLRGGPVERPSRTLGPSCGRTGRDARSVA